MSGKVVFEHILKHSTMTFNFPVSMISQSAALYPAMHDFASLRSRFSGFASNTVLWFKLVVTVKGVAFNWKCRLHLLVF